MSLALAQDLTHVTQDKSQDLPLPDIEKASLDVHVRLTVERMVGWCLKQSGATDFIARGLVIDTMSDIGAQIVDFFPKHIDVSPVIDDIAMAAVQSAKQSQQRYQEINLSYIGDGKIPQGARANTQNFVKWYSADSVVGDDFGGFHKHLKPGWSGGAGGDGANLLKHLNLATKKGFLLTVSALDITDQRAQDLLANLDIVSALGGAPSALAQAEAVMAEGGAPASAMEAMVAQIVEVKQLQQALANAGDGPAAPQMAHQLAAKVEALSTAGMALSAESVKAVLTPVVGKLVEATRIEAVSRQIETGVRMMGPTEISAQIQTIANANNMPLREMIATTLKGTATPEIARAVGQLSAQLSQPTLLNDLPLPARAMLTTPAVLSVTQTLPITTQIQVRSQAVSNQQKADIGLRIVDSAPSVSNAAIAPANAGLQPAAAQVIQAFGSSPSAVVQANAIIAAGGAPARALEAAMTQIVEIKHLRAALTNAGDAPSANLLTQTLALKTEALLATTQTSADMPRAVIAPAINKVIETARADVVARQIESAVRIMGHTDALTQVTLMAAAKDITLRDMVAATITGTATPEIARAVNNMTQTFQTQEFLNTIPLAAREILTTSPILQAAQTPPAAAPVLESLQALAQRVDVPTLNMAITALENTLAHTPPAMRGQALESVADNLRALNLSDGVPDAAKQGIAVALAQLDTLMHQTRNLGANAHENAGEYTNGAAAERGAYRRVLYDTLHDGFQTGHRQGFQHDGRQHDGGQPDGGRETHTGPTQRNTWDYNPTSRFTSGWETPTGVNWGQKPSNSNTPKVNKSGACGGCSGAFCAACAAGGRGESALAKATQNISDQAFSVYDFKPKPKF